MYPKAEILFPAPLISRVRDLKGPLWAALVDRAASLPETHIDSLAFCLLMMRLDGCLKCYSGSYKFMRGCEACALQSVMQFKGSEDEMMKMYTQAQQDVRDYLAGKGAPADGNTPATP
ncbi:MAG: hypothetical protein K1X65_09140 [Caldilineales bacterium]|nr:hypothetical protein [Caldilineales bacterium]MCW5858775.1 hypothetical protein [Caldilineales bacterium]